MAQRSFDAPVGADSGWGDDVPTPAAKPASASRTTLSHIMSAQDANLYGTGHGGVVMKLVDDAAAAVAGRHSGGPAVTAAVDELAFLVPARVGDLVHAHAQVNWTGRTSMEIGVRVMAERWNESTPANHIASAYLTFVAIDPEGRPRPVPPVRPETAEDHRRFREAEIRRTHRLARRQAIQLSRADDEAADVTG
ncbi:acyl-CoA thioesterase [Streptoalloteichus hindustanus]|uniref:Acyl-CoA hydrolase n=1 Tax=Streptoalloteichus hindustanus TaxID=2017 RepID=A0A1M5H8N5_STRHI|nr:acyl-CoA thioesterase [Streptoalloteichus hindustanus]SHG12248.1 Acyl-CoA hydrolase [Streptoalloteichus hindustanus]